MSSTIDITKHKRKFLVAVADANRQESYKKSIHQSVANAVVIFADDGLNVVQKIENDPPNILLIDEELSRISGTEVVRRLLDEGKHEMAIIILSELPEHEDFVDPVAIGQVQYLDAHYRSADLTQCLTRALNWVYKGDQLNFRLRALASGEVLIRQGERAEYVYILKRGRMHAVSHQNNTDIVLGQIEQQEFVGEMAYLTGEARSADVVASTDCELIEIPIGHLSHLLFEKPSWAKALMRTLAKRLTTANRLKTTVP